MARNLPRPQEKFELLTFPESPDLKGGGGGGTFDGMEGRVSKLEDGMTRLEGEMRGARTDISSLKVDIAELKGKVSMLPGYPGIATIMALVGGALLVVARLFPSGTP